MSVTDQPLRSESYIAELFEMLVDKKITLTEAKPFKLGREPAYVGVFLTEAGDIGGIMLSDVAFAALTGAALSLVPANEAKRELKTGKLSPTLIENYREVVNVASRLFSRPSTPRVIFDELIAYPARMSRELIQYIAKPAEQVDYHADIAGYGEGRFSLLLR